MPKKKQTYTSYTVIITRYANEAMRERFEQREPQIADFAALVSEFVYMGSSEARAGIAGKVSPHWMRHAHATHSIENGAPITLVQSTLGHKSIETTSRYTHVRPNASSGQYLKV